MESEYKLNLPESHLHILRVVSAMAWADGNLSEEEAELLINEFKEDLPENPSPILYLEDTPPFFSDSLDNSLISEQLTERINAELALKEILIEYKYNPVPLATLVNQLKTQEDRCLSLKLAYMIIQAHAQKSGELISLEEKKAYRQLVDLLNLDENLVKEIELQANQDLAKFKHPFQAFIAGIIKSLDIANF